MPEFFVNVSGIDIKTLKFYVSKLTNRKFTHSFNVITWYLTKQEYQEIIDFIFTKRKLRKIFGFFEQSCRVKKAFSTWTMPHVGTAEYQVFPLYISIESQSEFGNMQFRGHKCHFTPYIEEPRVHKWFYDL